MKNLSKEELVKVGMIFEASQKLGKKYLDEMQKELKKLPNLNSDDRIRLSINSLAMTLSFMIAAHDEKDVGKALDNFVTTVHGYIRLGGLRK